MAISRTWTLRRSKACSTLPQRRPTFRLYSWLRRARRRRPCWNGKSVGAPQLPKNRCSNMIWWSRCGVRAYSEARSTLSYSSQWGEAIGLYAPPPEPSPTAPAPPCARRSHTADDPAAAGGVAAFDLKGAPQGRGRDRKRATTPHPTGYAVARLLQRRSRRWLRRPTHTWQTHHGLLRCHRRAVGGVHGVGKDIRAWMGCWYSWHVSARWRSWRWFERSIAGGARHRSCPAPRPR